MPWTSHKYFFKKYVTNKSRPYISIEEIQNYNSLRRPQAIDIVQSMTKEKELYPTLSY